MTNTSNKALVAVASLAALLSLGACGDRMNTADANKAGTETSQGPVASGDVKQDTGSLASSSGSTAAPSSDTTAAAPSSMDSTASAPSSDTTAAAGTASTSPDTSALGAGADKVGMIDDAQIVTKVNMALAADNDLSALKINVDSKKGVVTLNGKAPDAAAKDRAAEIARNVKDVKSVDNKLTVG